MYDATSSLSHISPYLLCNLVPDCRIWDNSVGMETHYGAGRSGDRIPVVTRFSALVLTGPGNHSASYTMGTGSFPGLKRPGRGVDHLPTSTIEVKQRIELYLYSPSGSSWPVLRVKFTSYSGIFTICYRTNSTVNVITENWKFQKYKLRQ
jgi:hypothetical protein